MTQIHCRFLASVAGALAPSKPASRQVWLSQGLPAEPSPVTSMDCDFLMDEQQILTPYR